MLFNSNDLMIDGVFKTSAKLNAITKMVTSAKHLVVVNIVRKSPDLELFLGTNIILRD